MIRIARRNLEKLSALLAVIFLLVQVAADLYLPTITSDLIDKGVINHDMAYIWQQGGIMLLVAALGLLASACNVYFASTQGMKVGQKLRRQIYHKVLTFSSKEMSDFGDSSLITRSTNDIVQVQNVMVQFLRMMLQSPIMLVAAIILAYHREPRLTGVFAISLSVLAIVVIGVMYFAVPLFKSIQKKTDRINLVFREGLTGVRVIRAFNQDQREQDRFEGANADYTNTGIKAFTLVSLLFPIMTLILSLTNIGIIWVGAKLIANMSMQVGNLIAFMTYSTQILMSFMMLSMLFVFIPRASASAARLNEVLDRRPSVSDPTPDEQLSVVKDAPASLTFDHVNFRYEGAEELALTDLNFKVQAGQTLAIIGGTGSGKSSLVNLIPHLFNVESGRIEVNGQPIDRLSQHDLHQEISITQQKAVLFTGTVRSNLQFGYETATEDDMWRALEIAQAADFVREEGGLDTIVEQDGSNFSGGQRQRLAIARTIIKPASVYIFDDSFSALDFKTDAKLRQALRRDPQIQRAVSVIVAQQISTVADANLISILVAIASVVFQVMAPKVLGEATTVIYNGILKGASEMKLGMHLSKYPIDFTKIGQIVIVVLVMYALSGLFSFVQQVMMTRISQRVVYQLRQDFKSKMFRLPVSFYDTHPNGDIMSRMVNDMDNISGTLQNGMIQIITSALTFVGVLALMISISWKLTLVALITVPLSLVIIGFVAPTAQRLFDRQQAVLGKINAQVEETYAGHTIVRTFNREADQEAQFEEKNAV